MLYFSDKMKAQKHGGDNMKLNPVEDRYTRRMRERERTLLIAKRRMEKRSEREIETNLSSEPLTNRKVEYIEQKLR
jgi:hypothetical protein